MNPYSPKRSNSISSSTTSCAPSHEQDQVHYKRVHVPLAYPSEAIKEHTNLTKSYVYPPLMSSSDDFFNPSLAQPITIPTTRANNNGSGGLGKESHQNSSQDSGKNPTSPFRTGSLPSMAQPLPSPPVSPWKRSVSFTTRPTRSATVVLDETPFPDLPTDVRVWTSSHVAEYLGYSLRRYPRAITEDLGRYVRQTACLDGAQFIDLREEDLVRMQINLKWRTMIMKAVGMLRRETVRASRVDTMRWEEGHDADKDEPLAGSISSNEGSSSSDSSLFLGGEQQQQQQELQHPTRHQHHSSSASAESQASLHRQDPRLARTMEPAKETALDPQELRKGIVEDITEILQAWRKEQEAKTKKLEQAASSGGLGFMEGVIIGGLLVAFMFRFSR